MCSSNRSWNSVEPRPLDLDLPFHALQTIGHLLCMRTTLSERTRQVEDWNGGMGLVTEEKRASGCEGKVLVNAAYLIDDDDDTW